MHMSTDANMFWSEEVGLISKSEDSEKRFWWTLPNCFAFARYSETRNNAPVVVCSPFFSSYNTKWRLALIRNNYGNEKSNVGLFLWKIEGSYHCLSDLTVKLGVKDSKHELLEKMITGELNSYGCFGEWEFERYVNFYNDREEFAADGLLRFFCEMRLETDTLCEVPPRSKFILIIIIKIFLLILFCFVRYHC